MSRHPTLSPIEHQPAPFCSHFETDDIETTIMSTSPSFRQGEYDPPSHNVADQDVALPSTITPTPYPQLILFGDSITEFATLTLQAYLQTQYVRRLDVLNRGFSGYTSPMALRILTKVLPPISQTCPDPDPTLPAVKIITIFFGANDAAMPPSPQHVPLPLYIRCIAKMIRYIETRRPEDNTKVIIITPPPVNEHQLNPDNTRRACSAGQYAHAAQQLAAKCNLPCVDIWSIFMKKAGWDESMGRNCCRYGEGLENIPQTHHATDQRHAGEHSIRNSSRESSGNTSTSSGTGSRNNDGANVTNEQGYAHTRFPSLQSRTPSPTPDTPGTVRSSESTYDGPVHIPGCIHAPSNTVLSSLLTDGLHLTTAGYKIVFWTLLKLIKDEIPEYAPEHCPYVISEWRKAFGLK